jgi:spermidine/putrescine transport system substrate-binding protein
MIPLMRYTSSFVLLLVGLLGGCAESPVVYPTPTAPPLAETLTVFGWDEDIQSIMDAFTQEYGVAIDYRTFISYEQAIDAIEAGQIYDVVFMGNDFIGEIVNTGLLAELNLSNIPNLRNVAVNFRDLTYDPGNRYSVPHSWGTSGLLVRTDLVDGPVTSWNDLWRAEPGRAGIWDDQRNMLGLALHSLGYSANTDQPEAIEAALERLLELKQRAVFLEAFGLQDAVNALADGQITIALGWAYQALAGRELNPSIAYIIPQEGTVLWLENLVIPANSPNRYTAEIFINFMLRPEIAAQYTNQTFYAVTVEPAREFIDPAILADPIVFPTTDMLVNAEVIMPLPPEVRALYDSAWQRFMNAMGDV